MYSSARLAPFVLLFAAAAAVTVFAVPMEVDDPAPPTADPTDVLLQELTRRSAVKRALIDDLAAGQLGLAEVAARFAAMDAGRPWHTLVVRNQAGATVGERYCRVVLSHVDSALARDPRKRALLDRLDAELARFVDDGAQLPEASGGP